MHLLQPRKPSPVFTLHSPAQILSVASTGQEEVQTQGPDVQATHCPFQGTLLAYPSPTLSAKPVTAAPAISAPSLSGLAFT